jgi:hypothetical protein
MMQTGGPVAFYEVAATLIPVLLLGGVAFEFAQRRADTSRGKQAKHPATPQITESTEGEADSSRDTSGESLAFGIFRGAVLPTFGAVVLVAELAALEAVATGETSTAAALVVCGTLAFGLGMAVVRSFQRPWLERGASSHGGGALLIIWVVSIALGATVMGALLLADVGTKPLWKSVAKQPTRQLSDPEFQQLWLGHLIATSDYRIDKLEAESATARGSAERTEQRITIQQEIQEQECAALKSLVREAFADRLSKLPTVCSSGE